VGSLSFRSRACVANAAGSRRAFLRHAFEAVELRLNRHGLEETETSITGKLARGTFAASFSLRA
jgi:hypothetical protein